MSAPVAATPNKRALVIGIDTYGGGYQLNGCVNDARAMTDILRETFDFSHENIRLLTNADATKDGILDAFDDLIEATNTDDVVVFFFAGHGSRLGDMEKKTKASGYTTALCPVDVTNPGPERYFLVDDEIHERLLALADRTSFITVIVDACHSGTVTRDIFGDLVRNMPTDDVAAEDIKLHTRPMRQMRPPSTSSEKGPSGWVSLSDNYVLIAGCRDEEVSNEFTSPDTQEAHGALTYFLMQELANARSGTTYRDVFERAAANVTAHKPLQHPQMEGSIDRHVFGVSTLVPTDFASVLARAGDRVTLNRGVAHGVTKGSVYSVYPQGTNRIPAPGDQSSDQPALLGEVEIVSVAAVQSVGRIMSVATDDSIVTNSRAFEIAHARGAMSMAVEIVARDGAEAEVAAFRAELARSPIVDVVSAGQPATPFARAYLIAPRTSVSASDPVPQLGATEATTWAVVNTSGEMLMPPKRVGDEAVIREGLEKVVRFTQALALDNPNPRSRLRSKFTLEVMRRGADGQWEVAKPEQAGGLPVLEDGTAFGFRVTSKHDDPVFISVIDFPDNYAIAPLVEEDGKTAELIANMFEYGTSEADAQRPPVIAGAFAEGESEQYETLKLFVTSTPADFSVLKQEGTRAIESPLTTLFRMAIGTNPEASAQAGTRAVERSRLPMKDPNDWTTVTAPFIIRKKAPFTLGETTQQLAADGTTLRATGLEGEVATHSGGAKRAPGDDSLDPLESALSETEGRIARTIELGSARVASGTRDASSPIIELSVPDDSNGVQLVILTDADGVVSFHFPSSAGTREIGAESYGEVTFRVPLSSASVEPGTRDLISAAMKLGATPLGKQVLSLVVYPALGGILGTIGEDLAQRWETAARPYRARGFTSDNYTKADAPALDVDGWKRLASGRALLLLHDTFDRSHGGFGTMSSEFVAELERLYDGRIFAFDHFTLSHDPRRNAKMLIDALKLPAETALDVDVLAHGRGGLVARALVEGGSATLGGVARLRVRDVIFAGTPNAGTPFADVDNMEKTLNRYTALATATLTQFGGPLAGGIFAAAKSAAFKMAAQLKGVSAMKPGSQFLDSLKSATAAPQQSRPTRYFAIASDFEPQEPGLVRRLRNVMADKTISGANDLIVSTKSVLETPAAFPIAGSLVLSQTDGVAHGSYFANTAVRSKILEWLRTD